MTAQVRVSGPPNSSFVIGYPGISATAVRETAQKGVWGRSTIIVVICELVVLQEGADTSGLRSRA